jgi:H+/gluconate symporter-like permease
MDKISVGMFIAYLINGVIIYGILYGSLIWAVNEKTPHYNDTTIVTKEHVSENYRIFSVRLMTVVIMFMSILLLTIAGFMWNGYVLADSPMQDAIFRLLGETRPLKPVMSLLQFDTILSVLSIPLFVYIVRCKAIRDIVSIKILKE